MTKEQFESNVVNSYSYLKSYGFKLGLFGDNLEDMIQDVMVKALQAYDKYTEIDGIGFKFWIARILRNETYNLYKMNSNIPINSYESDMLSLVCDNALSSDKSDNDISEEELMKIIKVSLSKKEYEIFMAVEVHGYLYRQVAEMLDVPIGTIKSTIFNSRKKIMDNLKKHGY